MPRTSKFSYRSPNGIRVIFLCLIVFQIQSLNAQSSKRDSLSRAAESYTTIESKQDTAYINLIYNLGRETQLYNLDSLLLLSKEAISISKSFDYTKGEIQGLINLGSYYSEIGDHEQAIQGFKKALSYAKAINLIEFVLLAKNLLAIEYEYSDDYAMALSEYLEGIEIAKEYKDHTYISTFYVNTSHLYIVQNEYEQGVYFLNLAKANNEKLQNDMITGVTLANLAATYITLKDLGQAEKNADESILIFEELGMENWMTYAYELKGHIYLEQNKPNESLEWYQKSEQIHQSIDQTRYKIPLFNGMAQTYFDLNDYDTSEKYAEKALEISKNINLLEGRDECLSLLYKLNKASGNPEIALAYLEELKNLTDTLNIINNEKEFRILKSNLAFDQEKEKYVLENEKEVNLQKAYLYGSLFLVFTAVMTILLLRKTNKIQSKLNKKLILQAEQLRNSETTLKNANDTKSRLFSIIAHDLKGPISSFKAMFDLFNLGAVTESDFKKFAPKMSETINNISFTLNNLLSWGQSQMEGMITQTEQINVKALVDENIGLLEKIANQKSIKIISELENDLLAWADRNQIDIVIRNLISNAIKFTPNQGLITIGFSDQDKFWEIWIQDTGVGISAEDLDKIFIKEESISTYGTNHEKGTGIGLKLCKELVERNKGVLRVESTVGAGACFFFTVLKNEDKT